MMPEPAAGLLKGKILLIGFTDGPISLKDKFARIEKISDVMRQRSGVTIEAYEVDLADTATGDALDRSPPPELLPR